MANIKISDLAAATSVAEADLFEVSQGSGTLTSRKATAALDDWRRATDADVDNLFRLASTL